MSRIADSGLPAAAAFALVWLVASFAVDGTTFHLAPVIVVGAAAYTARKPVSGLLVGLAATLVVGLTLEAAGRLDGPSLLPWGDATLETAAFSIGAVLVAALLVAGLHRSAEPTG